MTAIAVARSTLTTTLVRYSRSWGLWAVLLVGPIGARFMIARDDGAGLQVAIGNHLPVLTSATLGVCLGVIVSTLLLPVGFLYLRSNTTRRQPWQVDEVSVASRVAIALGRFGADAAVLLGVLAALTIAGWVLGWMIVSGPYNPGWIALPLWLVAAPALVGLAAVRTLLDARPLGRRGFGDLLFFVLWMASIIAPAATSKLPSSFATNVVDYGGFVRPLVDGSPDRNDNFSIGGTDLKPGRVPLATERALAAPGYVASRFAWLLIAVGIASVGGLIHAPHTAPRRRRLAEWLQRLNAAASPAPAQPDAPPAPRGHSHPLGLVATEFRLLGAGRLFLAAAALVAFLGLLPDYRHIGSPAALLLLLFGLSGHAGQREARGLAPLIATTPTSSLLRRTALALAGTAWIVLLSLPAAIASLSIAPIVLAAWTGAATAGIAIGLATIARSGFAARLVLLILWYAYLSS